MERQAGAVAIGDEAAKSHPRMALALGPLIRVGLPLKARHAGRDATVETARRRVASGQAAARQTGERASSGPNSKEARAPNQQALGKGVREGSKSVGTSGVERRSLEAPSVAGSQAGGPSSLRSPASRIEGSGHHNLSMQWHRSRIIHYAHVCVRTLCLTLPLPALQGRGHRQLRPCAPQHRKRKDDPYGSGRVLIHVLRRVVCG